MLDLHTNERPMVIQIDNKHNEFNYTVFARTDDSKNGSFEAFTIKTLLRWLNTVDSNWVNATKQNFITK